MSNKEGHVMKNTTHIITRLKKLATKHLIGSWNNYTQLTRLTNFSSTETCAHTQINLLNMEAQSKF